MINKVQHRKKENVNWAGAAVNLKLYNEDGVRTLEKSKANIRFVTGETVVMDENSFIVVRPEKKREELSLFSGAVRASKAKVLTDSATIEPRIDKKGPTPDYKTRVKLDKTTVVEVFDGEVDVSALGKTVTLTKGFGTQVKFMSTPSAPKALPPLPEFDMTAKDMNIEKSGLNIKTTGYNFYRDSNDFTKSNLSFELTLPATKDIKTGNKDESKVLSNTVIKEYHIQIAQDSDFIKPVIDEVNEYKQKIDLNLDKYKLPDGTYYYRIAYVDDFGFESKFTLVKRIVLDTSPPEITLMTPQENQQFSEDFIYVEGTTKEPAMVTINDKTVMTDEQGNFNTALTARIGRNEILVIAKDKAGNSAKIKRDTYKTLKAVKSKFSVDKIYVDDPKNKWMSTPATVAISITTFLVILAVVLLILAPPK
jgi:hypothetical protein